MEPPPKRCELCGQPASGRWYVDGEHHLVCRDHHDGVRLFRYASEQKSWIERAKVFLLGATDVYQSISIDEARALLALMEAQGSDTTSEVTGA